MAVPAEALSQDHMQVWRLCEYVAHVGGAWCICHDVHVVQIWQVLNEPLELVFLLRRQCTAACPRSLRTGC